MIREKSKLKILRQKIHIIIYGTNTVAGRLFDLILLGLILLSVLLVMLETVQGFDVKYHDQLIILEWIITVFFTLEYVLRIAVTNKPLKYIASFYGIIDLIAILPMYLAFFLVGTKVFSVIRSLRLLRLFKILNNPKFSVQSLHLVKALKASRGKITVFMYFVLISTIIIGSIMYIVEGEENGFTSIPTSIYWTIVTLTTVGYGDISPVTPLGQFIASFVMILGYGIIAVPTGIVTTEMAKSTTKKPNINNNYSCNHCDAEDHQDKAKFCYHCGSKLVEN
ncbi:ion transporter [Flavobacterium cellulosilyticum]|uniref:Ion transporter n=1 Tax=Flavobacterium cellulosilyticum TaxID=2541731 RepID=A0A4R5CKM7_9FLAO|nr:ion transporter [Flavobacterium cellulosilyticum]TDD97994.1 ion transporter [Flavobacterium cellulosilyticum]